MSADRAGPGRRGQFVLLAAGVIAIGLLPVVFASLQLGYAGDVAAGGEDDDALADARRHLALAVHRAGYGVPANATWAERRGAAARVRDRLAEPIGTLERSDLAGGTVVRVSGNASAARAWAGSACPGGPDRQFGPCEAIGPVVVQERAGRTHVLAVVFDVQVTGRDRTTLATFRLRVVPRG